jgi:hypothetical protein
MFNKKEKNEESERKSFKEIWQNKRYKALIQLGLYLIFFIFLFSLISKSNEPIENETGDKDNNKIKNNFAYNYTFEIKKEGIEKIINYTGLVNNDENLGKKDIDNKVSEYYLKGDKTYILGVVDGKWREQEEDYNIYEEMDVTFINYDNIQRMIEKSELVSTETLHREKMIIKNYEISLIDTINIYNDINNIELENEEEIEGSLLIKLYEKDNLSFKIEMDITDLIKYYDALIERYFVILDYSDIGNVSSIDLDLE